MKIKLTKTQVLEELLENQEENSTEKINEWATKHDYHSEVYVSKIGDKFYKYILEYSYNEGCITFDYQDTVDAVEVIPVEKIAITWKVVKDE